MTQKWNQRTREWIVCERQTKCYDCLELHWHPSRVLYTDELSSCEFDTRQEDKEHSEKWKRKRQDLYVACLSSCREIYFSFILMMMETTNKRSPASSHSIYLYLSKFAMLCVLSLSWFMLWCKEMRETQERDEGGSGNKGWRRRTTHVNI